jgi:hypothetical protein
MTAVLHGLLLAAALAAEPSLPSSSPDPSPPEAPAGSTAADAPPPAPCPDPDADADAAGQPGLTSRLVEASHQTLERGMNVIVLRLNRFFGEPVEDPAEPPTSRIRLRNEVRTGEDDSAQARTSVAADLRLPAADRMLSRLRLVLTGETEQKPAPDTDVDHVPPRFDARVRAAGGALELRYDLFRARRTLLDAGAGVRFGMPPPPFTRLRLAQGFPLGLGVLGHVSQSLFWDRREGFGETTRLDVDRAFGRRTAVRWWSVGTVDEVSRGYEWVSELGVQRALGARTGLYTAAALAGATRAVADVERYRIYTRLRRDVHRGWAFLEVEPEVVWPADELTGSRSRVLGVILRLELLFSSNGRAPTPLCATGVPAPVTASADESPGGV